MAHHPGLFGAPGPVPCCYASILDSENCTCWRAVIAPYPTRALQAGPSPVRSRRCGDCAYRQDSPERTERDGDSLPYVPGQTFYCHDGLPKAWAWVHPDGTVRLAGVDDYQPVMQAGRVWQADGRPAVVCAGWASVDRCCQLRPGPGT